MRHADWEPTDAPDAIRRARMIQLCELVLKDCIHEESCFISRHAGKDVVEVCDCEPVHEVRELFHDPVRKAYYSHSITAYGDRWLVALQEA